MKFELSFGIDIVDEPVPAKERDSILKEYEVTL